MKREIAICIICIAILMSFCGCTENNGESGTKTVTMSVQELLEDRAISTSVSGGVWTSKIDYASLDVGDVLFIVDDISAISSTSTRTTITFDVVYTYSSTDVTFTELSFIFEGDLTNTYAVDDTVRITLIVHHTTYSNETSGMSLDYEVFEEGWDQTYFEKNALFSTNFFWQIFPESAILKVE